MVLSFFIRSRAGFQKTELECAFTPPYLESRNRHRRPPCLRRRRRQARCHRPGCRLRWPRLAHSRHSQRLLFQAVFEDLQLPARVLLGRTRRTALDGIGRRYEGVCISARTVFVLRRGACAGER